MLTQEVPFRRQDMTLRQVAEDPKFSKGWHVKVADEAGTFAIPLNMFFSQMKSEHNPEWDIQRTAFFNDVETVVLLVQVGYTDLPVVTLLHWTVALNYIGVESSK